MTTKNKDWHAWLNTMPPRPDTLHVVGDVMVANPGVTPVLTMREPQGINPNILILDLQLVQQPGMWPQVVTSVQARFDRVIVKQSSYTSVDVYLNGSKVTSIDHIDIVT